MTIGITMNYITIEIFFVLVGIILLSLTLPRLAREMNKRVAEAESSLIKNGYAIETVYIKPTGQMLRIWGILDTPTPFYLQVSSIDPVSVIAGEFGIADIRIGDNNFDSAYVIRTNSEEKVKAVLSAEVKATFFKYKNVRLRTGSIYNLLSPEYLRKISIGRDQRNILMLEVQEIGDVNTIDQNALVLFYNQLKAIISKESLEWKGDKNLTSGFFEGR